MDYVIETIDVTKTYMSGGRPLEVLKGIDLKVEPGEFMAIMGSIRRSQPRRRS